jgi:hypothetical protein
MSIYLGIAIIMLVMWQIIKEGWLGWIGVQTIRGVKKRKSTDVSNLQWTPSSRTQEIITSLNSIGFHRLGEALSILPYKRYVPVWTLVNADNIVQAEVVFGWMSLSTYFQDNVLVVTDYPSGEHIEMPRYQSHTVSSTINDAYMHHLEQVDKFRQQYGSPNLIKDMGDYLKWETVGRINYGGRKLKNLYRLNIIRLTTLGYAAAICTGIPLLFGAIYHFPNQDVYNILAHMELLIIGFTYPAIHFPSLFSRWQDRQVNNKVARAFLESVRQHPRKRDAHL